MLVSLNIRVLIQIIVKEASLYIVLTQEAIFQAIIEHNKRQLCGRLACC